MRLRSRAQGCTVLADSPACTEERGFSSFHVQQIQMFEIPAQTHPFRGRLGLHSLWAGAQARIILSAAGKITALTLLHCNSRSRASPTYPTKVQKYSIQRSAGFCCSTSRSHFMFQPLLHQILSMHPPGLMGRQSKISDLILVAFSSILE